MSEPILTGTLVGAEGVEARLKDAPANVLLAMRLEVGSLTTELFSSVRDVYLSGRALNVDTGLAKGSVKKAVRTGRYSITGTVWAPLGAAGKDAPFYLRFWEYGFKRTTPSGEVIKQEAPRASFHPALDAMRDKIQARLQPLAHGAFQ